ncbi:DUF3540 domain-containing protein [Chitinolyticbacter meiyuanensis]|uniref:DUF3540 domain-containing protein n=1 Tax=Chitinolyticbacter meiyuanensis TaxID=682798 RepID=UPI0011E5899D|nr:DUF3540 domain-containing protein [Chitinolyticbacter meiyuanensis]
MSVSLLEPITATPAQALGVILANLGEGMFLVDCAGRGVGCRRAASCLLLPEVGDTVLLATAGTQHYLVAVIECASHAARIQVEGDLVLSSAQGAVRIESATALQLEGARFGLNAKEGDVRIEQLRFSGKRWEGAVGTLRRVGQLCETLVDRVMVIAKSSFRRVAQIEQVRAAQLDYEGSARVRIRGKYTAVTGRDVIKAKARQVHIG